MKLLWRMEMEIHTPMHERVEFSWSSCMYLHTRVTSSPPSYTTRSSLPTVKEREALNHDNLIPDHLPCFVCSVLRWCVSFNRGYVSDLSIFSSPSLFKKSIFLVSLGVYDWIWISWSILKLELKTFHRIVLIWSDLEISFRWGSIEISIRLDPVFLDPIQSAPLENFLLW